MRGDERSVSRGERAEEAEREAARQRLLALAEAERVPVGGDHAGGPGPAAA